MNMNFPKLKVENCSKYHVCLSFNLLIRPHRKMRLIHTGENMQYKQTFYKYIVHTRKCVLYIKKKSCNICTQENACNTFMYLHIGECM